MTRAEWLRRLGCILVFGAAALTAGCEVGVEEAAYPVYDDDFPAACIATTDPVYFGGYPTYWCDGVWYFRGAGGRWGHYDHEPAGLRGHRAGGGPVRRNYEPHPSGGGRGGGRGAGGGRGGGGGRR